MELKTIFKIPLIVFCMSCSVALSAQNQLGLKDLLKMALEQNYQIQIVKNNARIAENSNTVGNAGMLPNVDITAEERLAISNSELEFLTGDEQNSAAAKSQSTSASLDVTWVVFDGLAMFARKNQLEQLEKQSEAQTRFYIEQTVYDLTTAYFRLTQEAELLEAYRQSLAVSQTRFAFEKRAFDIGASTALDVQQARVDRNTDSSLVLTQKALIQELNIEINRILNRELTQELVPTDSILLAQSFDLVALMEDVKTNNAELNSQQLNELIALSESKIARGALFPVVELFGSYGYNKQASESGFLTSNLSHGPAFGVRVRFNLFSGGQERIRSQNQKIEFHSEELRTDNLSQELEASTRVAYLRWKSSLMQTSLEAKSVVAASRALQIAKKQYDLNTITSIEFRIIQLNAVNARVRFLQAQYAAKIRELQLYRLSGHLITELF